MGLKERLKKFDKDKFVASSLNETNVKTIFYRCIVKPDTKEENMIDIFLFDEAAGFEENNQVFTFDILAVQKQAKAINYIIGQLKNVHDKNRTPKVDELFLTYQDKAWTASTAPVMELLYLLTVNRNILKLNKQIDHITFINEEKPTLSPEDPNFEAWWEEHKSEWED